MLASANPPPTPSPDAAGLIARLARPAPASTAYVQVRFSHLLRKPLVAQGQLDYAGPGRLAKRVESPYHEVTAIADGAVIVQREGRAARHFSLDRAPELQALLISFSALLGGNAAQLEQFYLTQLVGSADSWTLTLTPRKPDLAEHLRDITVDGRANDPRCFTLREDDGDSSVMLLGSLAAAHLPEPLTVAALSALCRAAP